MLKTVLLAVLSCVVLISVGVAGGLKLRPLESQTGLDLPASKWPNHVDASNGCFGVITASQLVFRLYSPAGEIVFEKHSDADWGFSYVSMRNHPNVIVLIESFRASTDKIVFGYDLKGDLLAGPMETSNTIEASPSGAFYYSVSEFGDFKSPPQVFDSSGDSLRTFGRTYLAQMAAIDDSTLLFQEGPRVRVLSVPDMATIRDITPEDASVGGMVMVTALSGDGSTYAFEGADKIVILDLESGDAFYVPKDGGDDPVTSQFGLSQDGEYLVTYRSSHNGQKIDVFQRRGGQYVETVDSYYLPEEYRRRQVLLSTFVGNGCCGVRYFDRPTGKLNYWTFLFELPTAARQELKWESLDGFISFDSPEARARGEFRLNSVNSSSSKLLRIEGDRESRLEIGPKSTIPDIPKVDWPYHFAAADSTIAVITKDRETLKIFRPGDEPLSVPSGPGWLYFSVSFSPGTELLLTGEYSENRPGNYRWAVRDHRANATLGQVDTRATLDLSPNGSYLYAVNDVGNEFNRPVLYDSAGELVTEFKCESGDWDIKFVNDTLVLYRGGGRLNLYTLPGLGEVASFNAGHVIPADLPRSTVSPDGTVYAFQSRDTIVVADLTNGATVMFSKPEIDGVASYPEMLLSAGGGKLLVFRTRNDTTGVEIYTGPLSGNAGADTTIILPSMNGMALDVSQSFVENQVCVANFRRVADGFLQYQAAVIVLDHEPVALDGPQIVQGLVFRTDQADAFGIVRMSIGEVSISEVYLDR